MLLNFKLYKNLIVEASSLSFLGLPAGILPLIEMDYNINTTAKWTPTNFKDILDKTFMKDIETPKLYIQVSPKYIKVFTIYVKKQLGYEISGAKPYIIFDTYKEVNDDFGPGWMQEERVETDFSKLVGEIKNTEPIYYLNHTDFKLTSKKTRNIDESIKELDNTTQKFIDYIENYIKDWKIGVQVQADSMSAINRYLYDFEERVSKIKNQHLTIDNILEEYGWDKVKHAFLTFIKTGKLIL